MDAGANAFLWWGLIYTAPPASITGAEERQKYRDEGLVLVEPEKRDGVHPFRERTPKYFTFKQFSRFVRPGYVRLNVPEGPDASGRPAPLVAAFRSPDRDRVVVVLINPDGGPRAVSLRISGERTYRLADAYVTDRRRQCEPAEWGGSLPGESVTTLTYEAR